MIGKVQGPLSFLILLDDGKIVRRYVDHVKARETMPEQSPTPVTAEMLEVNSNDAVITEAERQRSVRNQKPPSRLKKELEN